MHRMPTGRWQYCCTTGPHVLCPGSSPLEQQHTLHLELTRTWPAQHQLRWARASEAALVSSSPVQTSAAELLSALAKEVAYLPLAFANVSSVQSANPCQAQ